MDSLPETRYQLPDDPVTPGLLEGTWDSYRRALAMMASQPDGIERLNTLLAETSARLQQEAQGAVSQLLSEYAAQKDRPVQRSMPRAVPSPRADRGERPGSPPPAAWEILSASRRLGPRLAQKLTIAAARREARR